jgi:Na+/melibiose symporter-like transporter
VSDTTPPHEEHKADQSSSVLTGNVSSIKSATNTACLSIAIALVPAFVLWVSRQEKRGKPAIIPNSLWRNTVFTSICIDVFLAWGAFNATETLLTFFFQDVQSLSATQTSLRFLPAPASGIVTNIIMGLAVHKVRADWAVTLTMAISCISPLLTAIMKVRAPYWEYAFPAIALNAIGPDVLFTVSNLVITAAFPEETQALAGGVFNTVAQIGKSVGLALSAVIAGSITLQSDDPDKHGPRALMEGYRAAFWFILAITATTLVVSVWGLRNIGKIGLKRE